MDINLIFQEDEVIRLKEGKSEFIEGLKKLTRLTWAKARLEMVSAFSELLDFSKENNLDSKITAILGKATGYKFTNLSQIKNVRVAESVLDEGIMSRWWGEAQGNFYGAISFYPLLQAFIELDRVIKGAGGANMKYVLIYSVLWAAIVSGKVLLGKHKTDDLEVGKDLGKAGAVAANTVR